MYDPNLFQGDILLTPEQRQAIESGGDPSRATVNMPVWPNAVLPYTIDSAMGRLTLTCQSIDQSKENRKEL